MEQGDLPAYAARVVVEVAPRLVEGHRAEGVGEVVVEDLGREVVESLGLEVIGREEDVLEGVCVEDEARDQRQGRVRVEVRLAQGQRGKVVPREEVPGEEAGGEEAREVAIFRELQEFPR